jgi:hypothetical protein
MADSRAQLGNCLASMYRAEGVADYPDPAMLAGYAARHELYRAAVVATAIASVAAPFILVILG